MNILIMMLNTMESQRKLPQQKQTESMTNEIQSLTKEIYGILGMKGIVRMDYIINEMVEPHF